MSNIDVLGSGSAGNLTPQERAQVARLLGDPFSYPQSFKTWIVSFLSGSDLALTTNAILGLTDLIKATIKKTPPALASSFAAHAPRVGRFVAPGYVVAYAGASPPAGSLVCDGRQVSRSTYAALFATLGTRYGDGDGSTTFNLPDLTALSTERIYWLISY